MPRLTPTDYLMCWLMHICIISVSVIVAMPVRITIYGLDEYAQILQPLSLILCVAWILMVLYFAVQASRWVFREMHWVFRIRRLNKLNQSLNFGRFL